MPDTPTTENQNLSSHLRAVLSPAEFLALATTVAGSLAAVMSMVCRWYVEYQGQLLQLLLVFVSLASALFIVSRIGEQKRSQRLSLACFAFCTWLALVSWSPGFAFGLLVSSPVVFAMAIPAFCHLLGIELNPATGPNESIEQGATLPTSIQSEHQLTKTAIPPNEALEHDFVNDEDGLGELENAAEEGVEGDEIEQEQDDPWAFVQTQFQADQTLKQNIAQWEQPDGTQTVVANIRCRFKAADETCIAQLPFWPILKGVPEVYCRVASGPAASVKTTRALPHGLRLEIRLDDRSIQPSNGQFPNVIVEVVASVAATTDSEAAA